MCVPKRGLPSTIEHSKGTCSRSIADKMQRAGHIMFLKIVPYIHGIEGLFFNDFYYVTAVSGQHDIYADLVE